MVVVRDIENALTNVYIKIYKEIKKDSNYPDNLGLLQNTFNKLVYDNTRSAVEQSVLTANQKVNKKLKTQPFISQTDLDIIKKNTDEQVASFWRKLQIDMIRQQEIDRLKQAEIPDIQVPEPIDTKSYLGAVAASVAFSSFATATLSKLQELSPDEKPKVKWNSVLDSKTCVELPDGSEGCKQRDGRIYEADDFELQQHAPGEVHAWCRCTLEPII